MMPRAKMLARVKAPPVKMDSSSTRPPDPVAEEASRALSTPGSTMKLPMR